MVASADVAPHPGARPPRPPGSTPRRCSSRSDSAPPPVIRRRRRVRRLRLRRWRRRRGRLGVRVVRLGGRLVARRVRRWTRRPATRPNRRRRLRRRRHRRARRRFFRGRRLQRHFRPRPPRRWGRPRQDHRRERYRRAGRTPTAGATLTGWRRRPRRHRQPWWLPRGVRRRPRRVRPTREFSFVSAPLRRPAGRPRRVVPDVVPHRGRPAGLTVLAHFGNLYLGRTVRTVRTVRPNEPVGLFGRPTRGVLLRPRSPPGERFRFAPAGDGRPRRRRRRRWLRRRFWRPARRGLRRVRSTDRLVGWWWCRRRWWRRRRGVRRRRHHAWRPRRVVHVGRFARRRRRPRVVSPAPVVFRYKLRYRRLARRRRGRPHRTARAVRPDVATHLRRLTGLFVRRGRRAQAEQLVRRLDRSAGLDLLYRAAHVSLVGYPRTRAGRPVQTVALAPPGRVLARQWYTRAWRRRGERGWTARATAEFVRPTAVVTARTAYLTAAVAGRALL